MKIKTMLGILLLGLLVIGAAYNFGEKQKQTEKIIQKTENENSQTISPDQMVKTGPNVGDAAPDFALVNLAGETVKLSDLKGKKILVNFWATWCGPCRDEMPALEKFYQDYKDKNVEVLAVNLTSYEQGQDKIKDFIDTFKMTTPVLLDKDGTVGDQYQIYNIPTSYFINEDGIITLKSGPMTYDLMVKYYNKAFKK